ncbi:MAG: response regulator [Candidatus Rokubacteria bacterium]|nr:response regulator [Candidatus Rokubacteria bacterium]
MTLLGRILVVDDEAAVAEILSEYFTTQGYAVETAPNGAAALAVVARQRPDLVLLDMRMPGMDGMEVLRRIRAIDATVPVIMVTANEDIVLARETLKSGAFDYVPKPFDFGYLDRAVSAGLLQSAASAKGPADGPTGGDPWKDLVLAVFRAARAMGEPGKTSTGARLESAALAAARDAAAGRAPQAGEHLSEIEFLASVAGDLGDLAGAGRKAVDAALSGARRTLARGR